jgi:hypothetical protein
MPPAKAFPNERNLSRVDAETRFEIINGITAQLGIKTNTTAKKINFSTNMSIVQE